MAPRKKSVKDVVMEVGELKTEEMDVRIIGKTPLILNCMSAKAKGGLLLPGPRPNRVELESRPKHDPLTEYRDSVYRFPQGNSPTLLYFPGSGIKKAMATSALEIPGATKASAGRLIWVVQTNVAVYGIPQLYMAVVRNSDINHTPDIRTRAILSEWAIQCTISYTRPKITLKSVYNLLIAAGIVCGLGDGRQEKGSLNFGQFTVVTNPNNADFQRIVKLGGRKAQEKAMLNPTCYDIETESLYNWYLNEISTREFPELKEAS